MDGVDNLATSAPGWSSYRFAFNNPNMYTDPDGNLETTSTFTSGSSFEIAGGTFNNGFTDVSFAAASYSVDYYNFSGSAERNDGPKPENQITPSLRVALQDKFPALAADYGYIDDYPEGGKNIGAPGFGESLIPIWGSGRAAIHNFQSGNIWRGIGNTVLAISDVFLVKSLATAATKGAWKLGSNSWKATRSWYGQSYSLAPGTHVHHWAISRRTIERYNWHSWANQPWNLKPMLHSGMTSSQFHIAVHGWGKNAFNPLERLWYGTPIWLKSGMISGAGRVE
jgi:hypothetical protein